MTSKDTRPQPGVVGASIAPAQVKSVQATPVLAVHGLTKRFPGVIANDDVSLAFYAGEIHVVVGENGAGKSTLIAMLAGMVQPDAGEIQVVGRTVQIGTPRHSLTLGIGTVFQHVLLVPSLTVIENLMLGGPWRRPLARETALTRFTELSALLGIYLDPDVPLGRLSLGEQQQVEIIRALWRGGRVLILDEPTSMLTPQGVEKLATVLHRLRQRGVAVVLVTHKLAEAYKMGDRISVLRQGRVAGTVEPAVKRGMTEEQMVDRVVAMMFGRAPLDEATEKAIVIGHGAGRVRIIDRGGQPLLKVAHVATAPERGACALDDVSFDLWPGEILGLAGIDGNGQKHIAEMLAGQRRAIAGAISADGSDITQGGVAARRQGGIRYVTDDRLGEGSVGSLSVAINLVLKDIGTPPFWRHGIADRARIDDHARAEIRNNDIRTRSEQTPLGQLSGGNIQKVLLARELGASVAAADAKVIIFNKPTYGLDLQNARVAHARIRECAAAGIGILLISTDLDEVLALSDRIGVLYRGKIAGIVANGPTASAAVGRLMTGAQAA